MRPLEQSSARTTRARRAPDPRAR